MPKKADKQDAPQGRTSSGRLTTSPYLRKDEAIKKRQISVPKKSVATRKKKEGVKKAVDKTPEEAKKPAAKKPTMADGRAMDFLAAVKVPRKSNKPEPKSQPKAVDVAPVVASKKKAAVEKESPKKTGAAPKKGSEGATPQKEPKESDGNVAIVTPDVATAAPPLTLTPKEDTGKVSLNGSVQKATNSDQENVEVDNGDRVSEGSNTSEAIQSKISEAEEPEEGLKKLVRKVEAEEALFSSVENTAQIRLMTSQSERHMKSTAKIEDRFFDALSQNPHVSKLAELVMDDVTGKPVRLFYKWLSGPRDENKRNMLNTCLLVFGEKLRKASVSKKKLDSAQSEEERNNMLMYQPNSISTMHRQLFAQFRRNGIEFLQAEFKHGGAGTFQAYWKNKMAGAAKVIDNYGRTPFRSAYDHNEDFKLRNNANPRWNFCEFTDILHLLIWQLLTVFMLRGAKEPISLRLSDFKYQRQEDGLAKLTLLGINADKTAKLDLTRTTLRDDENYHSALEDPNDPFNVVNLYRLYVRHLPPGWKGTLLRKPVPLHRRKDIAPDAKSGFRRYARTDDEGGLGANDCNDCVKRVALRCDLDDPLKQMASGRRRAGITKLCNSNCTSGVIQRSARHQSCETNALYQIDNPEIHQRRFEAQRYTGPIPDVYKDFAGPMAADKYVSLNTHACPTKISPKSESAAETMTLRDMLDAKAAAKKTPVLTLEVLPPKEKISTGDVARKPDKNYNESDKERGVVEMRERRAYNSDDDMKVPAKVASTKKESCDDNETTNDEKVNKNSATKKNVKNDDDGESEEDGDGTGSNQGKKKKRRLNQLTGELIQKMTEIIVLQNHE